jgi:hypothetical protein
MALQKQEMIIGEVTKYWSPSTSRPGSFVVTREDNGEEIRFTIWLNRETGEKPTYLYELEKQLGDLRNIEGLNVVGTVRFAQEYDGVKQYNLNNIKLMRPITVGNTNTSKPLSSSEGAEKGNAISNATQLIIGYMSTHKGESPTKEWLDQQAELIIYGSESIRGLRRDIEDFEDIQTEEIVPSEDSDMPDDTGAIEL